MRKKLHPLSIIIIALLACSMSLFAGEKKLKITTSSQDALEHYLAARKALETTNFPAIAGHIQNALKADPNFAFALMLQSATQPNPRGLETLNKALEAAKNATDGERRYIEATITYRNGDVPGAISQLEKLLKDFPDDRGTWMFTAQLYQAVKRLDDAEKAFKMAMKLDDGSYRVYQLLSQLYIAKNEINKAGEILNKAEKLEGMEQQVLTALGTFELMQDHYAKARNYYKKATELVDRDATPFVPFFGQAWTYLYEGNPEPALAIVDEFMHRYNRNGAAQGFPPVWIWNHKGRINMEFGNIEEGMRCFETGSKSVNPAPDAAVDSVNKIVWLGRCQYGKARGLARMGKHEEAWKIVNKFKALIDENPDQGKQYVQAHHYMAGYLYNESGDFAKAIEHLKQASPNDPFHTLLLARAYEKSGDLENAKTTYEKITQMRVNNIERALSYPEAKKKLAMLSSSN